MLRSFQPPTVRRLRNLGAPCPNFMQYSEDGGCNVILLGERSVSGDRLCSPLLPKWLPRRFTCDCVAAMASLAGNVGATPHGEADGTKQRPA